MEIQSLRVFALLIFSFHCAHGDTCNLKTVPSCPKTREEWGMRAAGFNCDIRNYTCMLTENNTLVETCIIAYTVPATIVGCPFIRACDENTGPRIGLPVSYLPCNQSQTGCPPKSHPAYSVVDMYLYPACLEIKEKRTGSSGEKSQEVLKQTTVQTESNTDKDSQTVQLEREFSASEFQYIIITFCIIPLIVCLIVPGCNETQDEGSQDDEALPDTNDDTREEVINMTTPDDNGSKHESIKEVERHRNVIKKANPGDIFKMKGRHCTKKDRREYSKLPICLRFGLLRFDISIYVTIFANMCGGFLFLIFRNYYLHRFINIFMTLNQTLVPDRCDDLGSANLIYVIKQNMRDYYDVTTYHNTNVCILAGEIREAVLEGVALYIVIICFLFYTGMFCQYVNRQLIPLRERYIFFNKKEVLCRFIRADYLAGYIPILLTSLITKLGVDDISHQNIFFFKLLYIMIGNVSLRFFLFIFTIIWVFYTDEFPKYMKIRYCVPCLSKRREKDVEKSNTSSPCVICCCKCRFYKCKMFYFLKSLVFRRLTLLVLSIFFNVLSIFSLIVVIYKYFENI